MKNIALFILLFIGFTTNAQHLLSLSLGPSIPSGEFSNTYLHSEKSGYATTGVNLDLSYGYVFKPGIGMNLTVNHSSMPINLSALDRSIELIYGGDASTIMDNYELTAIRFGGLFSIGKKVRFDINPSIGILFAKLGEINCTLYNSDYSRISVPEAKGSEVNIAISGRLRIPVSKILDLSISTGYQYSDIQFIYVDYSSKFNQPISMLHANFGIVFKIQ